MNVWMRRVGWLLAIELLLIWALGSYPVWLAPGQVADAGLMRMVSVVGSFACIAALLAMRRHAGAFADWQGTLQFVACWTTFPLFKAIRQYWIATPADGVLFDLDQALWGGASLPEHLFRFEHVVVSEVLSFAYFCFYFVILLPVIWFSIHRRGVEAKAFFFGLSYLYLIGFAGYLLVPAGGPYIAFPELFPYPVQGGPMTAFLTARVAEGITGMDVFPSLHSGITLFVAGFFFTARERRGYRAVSFLLLAIVVGVVLATVYLRYHYGIDLIVGLLLGWSAIGIVNIFRHEESS